MLLCFSKVEFENIFQRADFYNLERKKSNKEMFQVYISIGLQVTPIG